MPKATDRVRVRMFGRVYVAEVLTVAVGKSRATVRFTTETGRTITKTLPVLAGGEWPHKNQACIWYDPPQPKTS